MPQTRRKAGTVAVSGLSPQQVADRAAALGARVEYKDGRYRVFPVDSDHPPVFFADRFDHNRTRLNSITALRRAGIDIINDREETTGTMTTSAVHAVNGKSAPPASKPGAASVARLEQQFKDLLELVTENDTDRDRELVELRARVTELETRLAGTPGAPPAKDPDGDLDDAILAFMKSAPIKLTAPAIHANLDPDVPAAKVAKRLQALAEVGKVVRTGEPASGNCIFHLPASGSEGKVR